mmetsp:Transcript_33823/g.61913  ORF Transcript_33823/g.61913 Transcript_33823/m.61913 type:complete len:392 (+) Transcript_33823:45-1220(+)
MAVSGISDDVDKSNGHVDALHIGEVSLVVVATVYVYGSTLWLIHRSAASAIDAEVPGFWGTLPSVWDHPEPNYVVSNAIGEFWSVLTTIPVAGALLMYQGLRYSYEPAVLTVYAVTCMMYTLAFSAHLTLQPLVFSLTVTSVMSNALWTFANFSMVFHPRLNSRFLRGLVVVSAFVTLVSTVATLPYVMKANGGVWTLFTVQTPGVILATTLASVLAAYAKTAEEKITYSLVRKSGLLLSTAMATSLIECLYGFEHGILADWYGFPWLHIIIHVLEQVGIYIYGVGLAALSTTVVEPRRPGAEVRHIGWLAYVYCPLAAAAPSQSCGVSSTTPAPTNEKVAAAEGMSVQRDAAAQEMHLRGRSQPSGTAARRRVESPAPRALLGDGASAAR